MIIKKSESTKYIRPGVDGQYYQLPKVADGTTFANARVAGEHGERTIGKRPRIYYILKNSALFKINGKSFDAQEGDLVVVPPNATYNYWSKEDFVDVILVMELLDLDALPK